MTCQGDGGDSLMYCLLAPLLLQAETCHLSAKRAIKPGSFIYFYLFIFPRRKRTCGLFPVIYAQDVTPLGVLGDGGTEGQGAAAEGRWGARKMRPAGAGGRDRAWERESVSVCVRVCVGVR